jgi:Zn-dependent protease
MANNMWRKKEDYVEDEIKLMKKTSIGKILFNILIVSLSILGLSFGVNPYFAIGYLFILVIHESGHYIAARILNLKVVFGGFTPFGAYIVHENTESCKENAIIAIGGPLFGGILGLVYYLVYFFTGYNTFLVLSFISIIINLMNLIPIRPLDGGHIAEAISPKLCYIGLPFLLYMLITAERLKSKIFTGIILLTGIYQTYNFSKKYKNDSYYKIEISIRKKFILAYSFLLLSLSLSAIYLISTLRFDELLKSISTYK